MKISTRGRYGVRAIFDIAYFGEGQAVQVDRIAERQEISPRYLEQIFQRLKKAGIIKTRRGAKGGYLLGKDPSRITVAQIVEVTDGPLIPVVCRDYGRRRGHCHRSDICMVKNIWDEAGKRLMEYLDSVTIAELCHTARRRNGFGALEQ